jgi:hypothetical protein
MIGSLTIAATQGKDQAADDIKSQFPELAKKTTFLWVGLFTSNFWQFPMMKPTEIVSPLSLPNQTHHLPHQS